MNDSEKDNKIKIEFAPGCFDDFDGTQEELDEMIAEITRMADSGELFENAIPFEDWDEETQGDLGDLDVKLVEVGKKRRLH